MSEPLAIKQALDQRFKTLLVGLAQARDLAGVESDDVVRFEQTEQNNARRELLRIEKQAIRDKELNKKSEQNYIDGIRDLVHESLKERIKERLADEQDIYLKVLGFDENLPELLDILSVKASSISKIEPAASSMPWLFDDLIKMVNMPKYRRTDARGKVVAVETMRAALSFIGIDNLKMVVPSLAFRRWIPQITDPYPEIKSRLWEMAIGTAMSCKRIAEVSKQDQGHAFTLGMFHGIGIIVVIRLYFRLFDELQREALIEAHNEKKREEHAALTQIQPSSDFLLSLIDQYAMRTSATLIEKMGMRRVFIANAMKEVAENLPITHASPMAQVLIQGIAYNRYRMLKSYKLLNMEEAKMYLRQFRMPPGALALLKTTDIKQLNLKMEDD